MNKNESKYFNTALKMDKAFLEILEGKDFAYITVKEICEKAGVNRSTFYLHYETIVDLLDESIEYMNEQFHSFMNQDYGMFKNYINDCSLSDLYLITPKYLEPYLNYIKEHRRLFMTVLKNSQVLKMDESYIEMLHNVIHPILKRYNVPINEREYIMSFYIQGLMAIITKWIENNCIDSIEHIMNIIQQCVLPYNND